MQDVLLLHGAIGYKDQLLSLNAALSKSLNVYCFNFSGHGGEPIKDQPFSIEFFANEVLAYMEEKRIRKTNIFGYSMGGYVGMYLARHSADKISKLITLATKFHWTQDIAHKENKMLDAKLIQQKVPAFAEQLIERHGSHWEQVLRKTSEMLTQLGNNNLLSIGDYQSVATPALLLLGDSDKMVSLNETVDVFKHMPNAQLGILPGTPHPIEQINITMLSLFIENFLFA